MSVEPAAAEAEVEQEQSIFGGSGREAEKVKKAGS